MPTDVYHIYAEIDDLGGKFEAFLKEKDEEDKKWKAYVKEMDEKHEAYVKRMTEGLKMAEETVKSLEEKNKEIKAELERISDILEKREITEPTTTNTK